MSLELKEVRGGTVEDVFEVVKVTSLIGEDHTSGPRGDFLGKEVILVDEAPAANLGEEEIFLCVMPVEGSTLDELKGVLYLEQAAVTARFGVFRFSELTWDDEDEED